MLLHLLSLLFFHLFQLGDGVDKRYGVGAQVGDTQFQLELQNVGGGILQVNVTGPTWVDIIPKTTTLGPAQTILVDVHVNPGSSVRVCLFFDASTHQSGHDAWYQQSTNQPIGGLCLFKTPTYC